jgi:hypothetical protein
MMGLRLFGSVLLTPIGRDRMKYFVKLRDERS